MLVTAARTLYAHSGSVRVVGADALGHKVV
jgi:hypothetical protein